MSALELAWDGLGNWGFTLKIKKRREDEGIINQTKSGKFKTKFRSMSLRDLGVP